MTIAIGLAAINTGNNLLYVLLGWLLSTIIASGAMSDMSLRGLRILRKPPPRVFANRPFLMEISVDNIKRGNKRRNGAVTDPDRIVRMRMAADTKKK